MAVGVGVVGACPGRECSGDGRMGWIGMVSLVLVVVYKVEIGVRCLCCRRCFSRSYTYSDTESCISLARTKMGRLPYLEVSSNAV